MAEKEEKLKSERAERSKKELEQQPTTDPKLSDADKTPGSGMMPDAGEAPSG